MNPDVVDALLGEHDGSPMSREARKDREVRASAELDKRKQQAVGVILMALRQIPCDDARKDVLSAVFDEFCQHCGTEQHAGSYCQCWNDE